MKGRVRRGAVFLTAVAGISLACLAAGGGILAQPWLGGAASPGQAAAGIVLLLLALAQMRIAWVGWRSGAAATMQLESSPLFWKWESSGPVLCYLAACWQGPGVGALFFFLAAAAAWHTLGVTPLVLSREARARWSNRLAARPLRTAGWVGYLGLAVGVLTESSVQFCSLATGGRLSGSYVAHCCALTPGLELRGRLVNERGYWDEHPAQTRRQGVFTIAALGDSMLLAGTSQTNHLSQVERRMPGTQIHNFGRPQVGPREYAALLEHDVAAGRPDMVLVYVSIGDDIVAPAAAPALSDFDWRGLGTYQFGFRRLTRPGSGRIDLPAAQAETDREMFLRRSAWRLAVCRTPLDEEVADLWDDALDQLQLIVEQCRQCGASPGLVLVPGEFQVSATLCDSLRRHAGYEPQQLDLDLPQRRLLEFASRCDVPVLDLLPHFRAANQSLYERNDVHWNEHGNSLAADALAHWLQRRCGAQVAATSKPGR